GRPRLLDQLDAGLVDVDRRPVRVERPLVLIQDRLHPADELGVVPRRDHPLLDLPELQVVFLSTRPTVLGETASTTRNSTSRSASRLSVQWARPAGGSEQARAIRRASARPSRTRTRLGRSWAFRFRARGNPPSTKRWRVLATVFTATSRAAATCVSRQAGPSSPPSGLSRMRGPGSPRAAPGPLAVKASHPAPPSALSGT